MTKPDQKITLGEMRASGVRGLLVYCCSTTEAEVSATAPVLEQQTSTTSTLGTKVPHPRQVVGTSGIAQLAPP
jgi:hypothetical protein